MTDYKIVRTQNAGVFFAIVENLEGNTATLKDSRRLWYWDGASSLSELAVRGVSRPSKCKFPVPVESQKVFEVIEILDMTDAAIKSIKGVPEWTQH